MRNKVCIITGTRAEYGLLKPLINQFRSDDTIDTSLVVTGSHLIPEFGNTEKEIVKDGIKISKRIPIITNGDSKYDMIVSMGDALVKFGEYFNNNRPDILIVLGDRYEIFAATTAAATLGIPVAHIHGGETTEGAVDEFFRHSITKMSYLHFTACEEYKNRVIQLGEDPSRVFNVGALGIENILNLPCVSKKELEDSLNFVLGDEYAIVTLHSVTQENDTAEGQVKELITAMENFDGLKFIITKANADSGGRIINSIWTQEVKYHDNWCLVSSLGSRLYLSALKGAKFMIGNSSSGIIEAPAVHIPTVNIGDRQKGRIQAKSIIQCDTQCDSIIKAVQCALSSEMKDICTREQSLFGEGNTSINIYLIVKNFLINDINSIKKTFYDLR